jgi:hypothetical protein
MRASTPPGSPGFAPPHQHPRRERDAGRVLVLNATYEPINVCTVRRATILLLKQKAELIERHRWTLRSEHTQLPRPMVIRLVTLRERAARDPPAQDHAPRGVRARRVDVPVLRRALEPHRRPRHPALEGRDVDVGEHRRVVRAVQPAQGRPAAGAGQHGPAPPAAAPNPHVFIHVASPTIPSAWKQWLPDAVSAERTSSCVLRSGASTPELENEKGAPHGAPFDNRH